MKFLCFLLIMKISAISTKSNRLESYHRFHKNLPVNRIPKYRSGKPNTDSTRKENTVKAREQAVRRNFCNAQTCLKCVKYMKFRIPSKQHLICKLTLALPQCCPMSIVLYSGLQLLKKLIYAGFFILNHVLKNDSKFSICPFLPQFENKERHKMVFTFPKFNIVDLLSHARCAKSCG